MTRHQLQVLTYSIAGTISAVFYVIIDYMAGYNAGVAVQLLVAGIALALFLVLLVIVALCVLAIWPNQKKSLRDFD